MLFFFKKKISKILLSIIFWLQFGIYYKMTHIYITFLFFIYIFIFLRRRDQKSPTKWFILFFFVFLSIGLGGLCLVFYFCTFFVYLFVRMVLSCLELLVLYKYNLRRFYLEVSFRDDMLWLIAILFLYNLAKNVTWNAKMRWECPRTRRNGMVRI